MAEVRAATRADVRVLGAVLGRAFVDDPGWAWVYPEADRAARLTPMFRALLAAVARRGGTVHTDEALDGAALWQPSDATDLGVRGNLAMGAAMLRGRADMGRCRELARATAQHRPGEAHWYLATLGTDPTRQGSGVGSGLVRHILEERDAAGQSGYLEVLSDANVPFYARFGFEVVGEFDVPTGGPHVWQLWREPPPGRSDS